MVVVAGGCVVGEAVNWVDGVCTAVDVVVGTAEAPTPVPMPLKTTIQMESRRTAQPNRTVRSLTSMRRIDVPSSPTVSPLRPRRCGR